MMIFLPCITAGLFGIFFTAYAVGHEGVVRDYCYRETFNASCPAHHVIVLDSAMFGRMALGRCITRSYGYLGCAADVRAVLDARCSGRGSCAVALPDPALDDLHPCPDDVKGYLQAAYSCIKVTEADPFACRSANHVTVTRPAGVLASVTTELTQVGSSVCPWVIAARPGQKILLELLDFGVWRRDAAGRGRAAAGGAGLCHIYASVSEAGGMGRMTVCEGEERLRTIYTSESSSVTVEVASLRGPDPRSHFLIKYRVLGCVAPAATTAMSVSVVGDTALLTCLATGDKWTLRCEQHTWAGLTPNCTQVEAWGLSELLGGQLTLPQGVVIALIIGVAVFIAVAILVVGVWALRRNSSGHPYDASKGVPASHYGPGRVEAYNKEHYPMLASQERCPGSRESDYATTWQRRAAMPAAPSRQVAHVCGGGGGYWTGPPGGCPYSDSAADASPRFELPPHIEHIYESPKFARKASNAEDFTDAPFYHELEPGEEGDEGGVFVARGPCPAAWHPELCRDPRAMGPLDPRAAGPADPRNTTHLDARNAVAPDPRMAVSQEQRRAAAAPVHV